jgi:hypothetical protein
MQRIRLLSPAFIGNHLYEREEIVGLPDGVKGPHRTVAKSHDRISYGTDPAIDANRLLGEVEDVPLYEEVKDDPVLTRRPTP